MSPSIDTLARSIFVAMLIPVAALLSGCGGGSTDSSAPARAEFVKRANAACKKERAGILQRINVYLERHSSSGAPESELFAGMVKAVLLPTIEAETKALESLEPPADDSKQVNEMLTAQRAAIAQVSHLRRVASMEAVENHFNQASDRFRRYGLESCANSAKPVDRRL